MKMTLNDGNEGAAIADARARIVRAASALIEAGGRDAATTRAVAAAANVQAPTIYRLFGDKGGLLDAVAEHALAAYIADKSAAVPHPDPLQELRDGWDMHVAFGLAHPGLFTIMSGDPAPRQSQPTPVIAAGIALLQRRIRNIALAGALRVSEERAMALIQASCIGTVLTLLKQEPQRRDAGLSVAAREALMAAITDAQTPSPTSGPASAAASLRASLDQTQVLSKGERLLLEELLERISNGG